MYAKPKLGGLANTRYLVVYNRNLLALISEVGEKSMNNRKFNQFQSYTLPLAGVLMVVGLIALLFG